MAEIMKRIQHLQYAQMMCGIQLFKIDFLLQGDFEK
jgi:hypothetical protein